MENIKNKMKKSILVIFAVLLLTVGVFATSTPTIPDQLRNFAEKKGISESEIESVEVIDYANLPNKIKVENIDDTNLEIYEITTASEKALVLTFGSMVTKTTPQILENRQFLNFGFDGKMNESGFLKTTTGITSGLNKGYVMVREGSITGISSNLEIINSANAGKIKIIIYKNGKLIRFGNEINADSNGMKKDYETQSKNIVTFAPGDLISVYAEVTGNVNVNDVMTMVEITTLN